MKNGVKEVKVLWRTWDPVSGEPQTTWELAENIDGMADAAEDVEVPWGQ